MDELKYETELSPDSYDFMVVASLMGEIFDLELVKRFKKWEDIDLQINECLLLELIEPIEHNNKSIFKFKLHQIYLYFKKQVSQIRDVQLLRNVVALQSKEYAIAETRIKEFIQKNYDGVNVLKYLLNHKSIVEGIWKEALPLISENLYKIIHAHQISIWAYQDNNNSIQCIEMYDTDAHLHRHLEGKSEGILLAKDHPHYFEMLSSGQVIVANNARTNPATYELTELYFKPMNVYALLDVPFFLNGKLAGVICFENKIPKVWSPYEIFFALSIGAFISLTYQALQRKRSENMLREANEYLSKLNKEVSEKNQQLQKANLEVKETNENLEKIVEQRTQNLQLSNAQLTALNEELDTFFYHAAHDLRRPLTNILGLLELGKMHEPSSEMIQLFGYINETVMGMDAMLRKLISLSAITVRQPVLEKINFEEIVEQVQTDLDRLLLKKDVHLDFFIATNIHYISQKEAVKTILFNIIENAVIFSNPQENPFVKITIYEHDEHIFIKIEDNGIGIAQEYHQQIYHLFFRGNILSQGNGLGLYIVKKAVEQLHGLIYLESEVKKGSTFIIKLPHIF
ncbi:MAG: GAF domain-containing sensor histidine kinase [Raineya sp.]|jgi:signal transduction histidine kinase|nr:GAF domain-containing sensor histidine kinase [Raineya sp.]